MKASWPVRITAGAFGENRPARDLHLSPQHAVAVTCIDEVLIPIKHLINDGTIARSPREKITYWHIELDAHDVILAENLPCESFLDTQGRVGFFDNGAAHAADHPDLPLKSMDDFCRPLVQDGPIVVAARMALERRMKDLGWALDLDPDLHVVADGTRVDGTRFGDIVRFTLPAGTSRMRLCSRSFVPREVEVDSGDGRRLGVPIKSFAICDGLGVDRRIAIDDASLGDGFNALQSDAELQWRWTDGDAALPPRFWEDCRGSFFLRVDLAAERGHYRAWTRADAAVVDLAEPASNVVQLKAG